MSFSLWPLRCSLLDLLADGARLLVGVPGGMDVDLGVLGVGAVGEQRLAEPALIVGDEVRGGAEDMRGGAVVALQPDDRGARKILVEAQDVVDLGAAPAIDRLVVVADAADVDLAALARGPIARLRRWPPRGRSRRPAPGRACGLRPAGADPPLKGEVGCRLGRCASSRSHRYCAVLVSWYSSTRMYLKRRWYSSSTSGLSRKMRIGWHNRSPKSQAFSVFSRSW